MSHVRAGDICKHLQHGRMSFGNQPDDVFVGVQETVAVTDTGQGLHLAFSRVNNATLLTGPEVDLNGNGRHLSITANGTDTSDHFANSHVAIGVTDHPLLQALLDRIDVTLGVNSDLRLQGITASSYELLPTGELDLFQGNSIVDRVNLHTNQRIEVASFGPSPGFDGSIHITTGRLSLGEGAFNGINPHVA